MSVYRSFQNASHLAAITGVLLYSISSDAPGVAFIGLPLIVFAWVLFRKTARSPLPRAVINVGLMLATLYMFVRLAGDVQDAVVVLAEYLVVLLLVKLFEHRTPRDQAQSLVVCGMLAVGAVLTDVSLEVGVLLIAHLFVLLVAAIRFQQFAGLHATLAPPNEPTDALLTASPTTGARTRARTSAVTSFLAVAVFAGAVMVFVVLPRRADDSGYRFGPQPGEVTQVSGFRDHMKLGVPGLIATSREVVMHVTLTQDGEPLADYRPRYYRGAVLDSYSGGSWVRSRALGMTRAARILSLGDTGLGDDHFDRGKEELPALRNPERPVDPYPVGVRTIEQRYELVNKTGEHLFALAFPVQVAYEQRNAIDLNPVSRILRLSRGEGPFAYRVRSTPEFFPPPRELEAGLYTNERNAPPVSPNAAPLDPEPWDGAVRELAERIMTNGGLSRSVGDPMTEKDERIVEIFAAYLRDSGRYAYTREMVKPGENRDPTDYFLFDSMRGHCEYFASALAGLCRSVGIDARVVTGFVSREVEPGTLRSVVRRSHAHAWVEAPVLREIEFNTPDGTGTETREVVFWRTYDASPEDATAPVGGDGFGLVLAEWVRSFEDLWSRSVIQYDSDAQGELFGLTGDEAIGNMAGALDGLTGSRSRFSGQPRSLAQRILGPALAFAGIAMLMFGVRSLMDRRKKPRAKRVRSGNALARRIDKALRRLGLERPPSRPLLDHAGVIGGEPGDALGRAADALYAQRFGGAARPDAVERAVRALEGLARAR